MNVGELLKERNRLLGVIDEAKTARVKLRQLNTLITLYGDSEHVDVSAHVPSSALTNGHKPTKAVKQLYCGKCDEGPYKGVQGLAMHNYRVHGGKVKVAS
jgi:hypothetical protein